MSTERRDRDSLSWQLWCLDGGDGRATRTGRGGCGDELKDLLGRWDSEEKPCGGGGLCVLLAGGDDEDGGWLADLGPLGLQGLLMEEAVAESLPRPFQAERIGFLPGVERQGEAFCAYRLAEPEAEPVVPVRGGLWDTLRSKIEAREREGETVFVGLCGAPGAGKSHLLDALAVWLAGRGLRVVRGSCLPSDVAGRFTPWRPLLQELGGEEASDRLAEQGSRLGLAPERARAVAAWLLGDEESPDLGSNLQRALLPRIVAGFLMARSAELGGLVLVIDDWQWLDEPGREVLSILRDAGPGLRVLAARRGRPRDEETEVPPLSPDESRELLSEFSDGLGIGEELTREVWRMSGGIPLVAREVLATMRNGGALRVVRGVAELMPGGGSVVGRKEGITLGLRERLLALPEELRGLLAVWAHWRQPFTLEQADWLSGECLPLADFERAWALPERAEFVIDAPARPGAFAFRHELLREAALSLADPELRKLGHETAWRWLRGRPERMLREEAHHARGAGWMAEAVGLLDEVAVQALDRFALREAREAVREAMELEREQPRGASELRVGGRLRVAGEAAFHSGELTEATALLESALQRFGAIRRDDRPDVGAAAALRISALLVRGRAAGSERASAVGLAAARAALMLGEIAYFQDQRKDSAGWCLLALQLASRQGDSAFLASLCAALAVPLSGRRTRWLARRFQAIGQAMIDRVGDPEQAVYVGHLSNLMQVGAGNWEEASDNARRTAIYWRERGHGRREEESWIQAFYSEWFLGRIDRARDSAEKLDQRAGLRSDAQTRLWGLLCRSLVALRAEGPAKTIELALGGDGVRGDVMSRHALEVIRAAAEWRAGKPWQAYQHLCDADDLAREEPPVSPMQVQLAEAALLFGELTRFGPAELVREPGFGERRARALRLAKGFAASFSIGRPLARGGRVLSGGESATKAAAGLESAATGARREGLALDALRLGCLAAILGGDPEALAVRVADLRDRGASAEAEHFELLQRNHEG